MVGGLDMWDFLLTPRGEPCRSDLIGGGLVIGGDHCMEPCSGEASHRLVYKLRSAVA